jgi:hypothetical protein
MHYEIKICLCGIYVSCRGNDEDCCLLVLDVVQFGREGSTFRRKDTILKMEVEGYYSKLVPT